MANELRTAGAVRTFIYAGDAIVTLQSAKTEVHFTYRISQATDQRTGDPVDRWFVSVLSDSDRYTYLGMVYPAERNRAHALRATKGSRAGTDAPSWRAFNYLLTCLQKDRIPVSLIVRHEGRCGRCRRPLTRPDSIDLGIGPDCAGKMGLSCLAA